MPRCLGSCCVKYVRARSSALGGGRTNADSLRVVLAEQTPNNEESVTCLFRCTGLNARISLHCYESLAKYSRAASELAQRGPTWLASTTKVQSSIGESRMRTSH